MGKLTPKAKTRVVNGPITFSMIGLLIAEKSWDMSNAALLEVILFFVWVFFL